MSNDAFRKIISGCICLNDERAEPGRNYISRRGLDPSYLLRTSSNVVFHESLDYYGDDRQWIGSYPTLIALCRVAADLNAPVESAMRIYLSKEGDKAPQDPCKKAVGAIGGASCLIGAVSDEMLVGEGLETTLAVSQATGLSGFATMMSSNLERFEPPSGVNKMHILVDRDRSGCGEKAAHMLAVKLYDLGIEVFLHLPSSEIPDGAKGVDWLDEFVNKGAEYVREEIASAAPFVLTNTDANLVRMSEVECEEVEWLLRPYMPRKKVTFLEGDPGLGKSFITLDIASAVSTGREFVRGLQPARGRVVLFCTEDGLGDTVRPRLEKMHADLNQISAYKIPIVLDDEGKKAIENALRTQRPDLVILDPLSAFLSVSSDINKANHARQFMSWLAEAAARFNCVILIIRHLTKGSRDQAIYRGLGSIDFTAAARSVLMVAASPKDKAKRAVFHTKSNLAPFGEALGYTVEDGRVKWTGVAEFKLEEFLDPKTSRAKSGPTAVEDAVAFLRKFLADGPKTHEDVVEKMKQDLAVSKRTLARAKSSLQVISFKAKDRENGPWFWKLPERSSAQRFAEPSSERFEDEDFDNEF